MENMTTKWCNRFLKGLKSNSGKKKKCKACKSLSVNTIKCPANPNDEKDNVTCYLSRHNLKNSINSFQRTIFYDFSENENTFNTLRMLTRKPQHVNSESYWQVTNLTFFVWVFLHPTNKLLYLLVNFLLNFRVSTLHLYNMTLNDELLQL